jgi:hypothetical protein
MGDEEDGGGPPAVEGFLKKPRRVDCFLPAEDVTAGEALGMLRRYWRWEKKKQMGGKRRWEVEVGGSEPH